MALSVIQESLEQLSSEWRGLLSQSSAATIFAEPRWQQVWWENFQRDGQKLLLLSVRDGERLVGIAPLMQRDGRLSFVGDSEVCDYMDFVLAPGLEEPALAAILDRLDGMEWAELELWGLAASSPTLETMKRLAETRRCRIE